MSYSTRGYPGAYDDRESSYSAYGRGSTSPPANRAATYYRNDKLDEELAQHLKKALSPEETAPKQKHVRSCIVYTWDIKGSGNIWNALRSYPMISDDVVTLKALVTIHKIINQGHPNALKDVAQDKTWIENLGRHVAGYGQLIKSYTQFLSAKLDYHRQHPEFTGGFDYQEYVTLKGVEDPNEGYETINDLLGLLKKIDKFAEAVFNNFRPSTANECKIAAFIPLIEESHGIYQFLVSMLSAMHQVIGSVEVLAPLRDQFNAAHYSLYKFYNECSNISYLTSLVTVPKLSKSPPDFLVKPPSKAPRRAPSPPPAPKEPEVDYVAIQQAELEAQIRAENARMEQQMREAAEQERLRQQEMQRQLELQRQMDAQRRAEEERLRQMQAQQAQAQALLEQQMMASRLMDNQNMVDSLRNQMNKDRELINQYEMKVRQMEQQLTAMSLTPRDDGTIKRLQDEIAQWKQKYEALAKLYAQLRKEHLDLLTRFKEIKDNSGKMADDVRRDLERAKADLKVKSNELTDVMIERDRLRGEADRVRQETDAELVRLRRDLADAKDSLVDMSKSKGVEISSVVSRFNTEKADLENAVSARQQQIDDLRRRLDQAMADVQRARSSQSEETAILQEGLDQTLLALSQLQQTQQETEASLMGQINRLQQEHLELLNRMMDNILQSCIIKLDEAVYELDSPSFEGNMTASPEYVQSLIEKTVSQCSDVGASFVRLVQGGDQADAIATSNAFAHAVVQLLHNTKGVTRLSKEDDATEEILGTARQSALRGRTMFERLKSAMILSIDPVMRPDHIGQLTRDTVVGLLNLNPLMDKLAPKASLENLGGDLGDVVEREMQAAARAIEEAARRLQELMANPTGTYDLKVHGVLLQSAAALTNAIQQLIRCATACQQEIVQHGRAESRTATAFYKKNNRWTEGLVSAAKAVAVGTTFLVECADGLVKGTHSVEQLIVAAQEVQVATTQLVAASRVKAVPFSKLQDRLEDAAVAVREATKLLVKAARDAAKLQAEEQARDEIGRMGRHEMKIREMEQQVKILELEKELGQARFKLGELRKQGYHEA